MNSFEHHYHKEMQFQQQRDRRRREEYNRRQWEQERRKDWLNFWLVILFAVLCAVSGFLILHEGESEPVHEPATLENVHLSAEIEVLEDMEVPLTEPEPVAQEPVTYEDWFRANATAAGEFKLTHYCTELYPHICGTGDGLTSTGVPVTPYWTCAVDPSVIPYGAAVMVDYGDRVEFWKAQDRGPSVKGNHLDLAVTTHDEAEELGIKQASVYWLMEDEIAHF
jgi:3D (Asp-Asp-Asp) domain-containing protein